MLLLLMNLGFAGGQPAPEITATHERTLEFAPTVAREAEAARRSTAAATLARTTERTVEF